MAIDHPVALCHCIMQQQHENTLFPLISVKNATVIANIERVHFSIENGNILGMSHWEISCVARISIQCWDWWGQIVRVPLREF